MATEVTNANAPVTVDENNVTEKIEATVVAIEANKDDAATTKPSADGTGDGKVDKTETETVSKPPPTPKLTVHKTDFEKDIIYLYQFSRTPLLPSLSPYCLKVETWLRLAGLKYENIDHKMKFRSKKGQLPFVEVNGEEIADSAIIIKELATRFNKDLDAVLTAEQRNMAYATMSMIENHLIWVIVWWRTKYPDLMLKGHQVNLQHQLGIRIPNSILNFFFKYTYGRKGLKKVKAQGIGVHSPEEIEEFGKHDLKVLSEMLADKPFYFGDEPTTLDVVSFAVLSQIHFISKDVSLPLRDFISESCPNLIGHVSRIKERCFPDWDEICTKLDLNAHIPKPEPESKEGKEGETEKTAEKETVETERIENELEKEKKVEENKTEKPTENKEKESSK